MIIIGSGLSALFSGLNLVRSGKKVLIIEKHNRAGGYAAGFERFGADCDTAMHQLGGLEKNGYLKKALESVDLYDTFLKQSFRFDYAYRVVHINSKNIVWDYELPNSIDSARKDLIEKFADKTKEINHYFDLIIKLNEEFELFLNSKQYGDNEYVKLFLQNNRQMSFYNSLTIKEYWDRNIHSCRLGTALFSSFGCLGTVPENMSFLVYAFLQYSYLCEGVHFFRGGSKAFTKMLLDAYLERRGNILLNTQATKIQVIDKKISNITCKKLCSFDKQSNSTSTSKNNSTSNEQAFFADNYIFNGSPYSLFNDFLLDEHLPNLRNLVSNMSSTLSVCFVFIVIRGKLKDLGKSQHATYMYREDDNNSSIKTESLVKGVFTNSYGIIDYGYDDRYSMSKQDRNIISAVMLSDYYSWNLSDEEYEMKKIAVRDIVLNDLELLFPGIKNRVIGIDVSTPRTCYKYTQNHLGAMCGFEVNRHFLGANARSINSEITNLFFASAWSGFGPGFGGVAQTGELCAKKILTNLHDSKFP